MLDKCQDLKGMDGMEEVSLGKLKKNQNSFQKTSLNMWIESIYATLYGICNCKQKFQKNQK